MIIAEIYIFQNRHFQIDNIFYPVIWRESETKILREFHVWSSCSKQFESIKRYVSLGTLNKPPM